MDRRNRITETVEPIGSARPSARPIVGGSVVGGRYEILERLGSGGSAIVYRALDLDLGREIALKVLRPDRMSQLSLAHFLRELAIARDIRSPYVIPMWDIGTDDERVWISMELATGETLRDRLERGTMEIDEAIGISCDVLRALDALHAERIVHRDIKPSNVLTAPDGSARVADLGLARKWDTDASRFTDALVGTYGYISPEQALGLQLDGRSDLYGFGVTLFEMLTGRIPFETSSSIGAIIAPIHDEAPDVRELQPDVPDWLATFITRLLAKDRRHRYANAAEALAHLRARRTRPGFVLRRTNARFASNRRPGFANPESARNAI